MRLRSRVPPVTGLSPLHRHTAPTSPPSAGKRKSSNAKSRRKAVAPKVGRKMVASSVTGSVKKSSSSMKTRAKTEQSDTDDVSVQTGQEIKTNEKRVGRKRKTQRFQPLDLELDKENSPVATRNPHKDDSGDNWPGSEPRRRFFSDPTRYPMCPSNGSSPFVSPSSTPKISGTSGDKENVRPPKPMAGHRRSNTQSPQLDRIPALTGRQILTPRRSVTVSPIHRQRRVESGDQSPRSPGITATSSLRRLLDSPINPRHVRSTTHPRDTTGRQRTNLTASPLQTGNGQKRLAKSDATSDVTGTDMDTKRIVKEVRATSESASVTSEKVARSIDFVLFGTNTQNSVAQTYAKKLSLCKPVLPKTKEVKQRMTFGEGSPAHFTPIPEYRNRINLSAETLTTPSNQANTVIVCCCQNKSKNDNVLPDKKTSDGSTVTACPIEVPPVGGSRQTLPKSSVASSIPPRIMPRNVKLPPPSPSTNSEGEANGDKTTSPCSPRPSFRPTLVPIVLLHPPSSPCRKSMNYHGKYLDLLLDHEVAEYTSGQVAALHAGDDRDGGANNPVAAFISDADDRHFRPIHMPTRRVQVLEGSAFSSIRYC